MLTPDALVERLFARFAQIYGMQRLAASWGDPSTEDGRRQILEGKRLWAARLSRFEPETIARAIEMLVESGGGWPPALPEFVETCRQAALSRRSESQHPALGWEPQTTGGKALAASALEAIAKPDGFDYLSWAKRPKSAKAVEFLRIGAQTDQRLRRILADLVRDPSPAQSEEARRALLAMREAA